MTATDRARELAIAAAQAASDKLAHDIIAYDVSEVFVITDAFVLASAPTDRQVRAIVDGIEERAARARRQAGPARGRAGGPLGAARLPRHRGARAAQRGARVLRAGEAVEGLPGIELPETVTDGRTAGPDSAAAATCPTAAAGALAGAPESAHGTARPVTVRPPPHVGAHPMNRHSTRARPPDSALAARQTEWNLEGGCRARRTSRWTRAGAGADRGAAAGRAGPGRDRVLRPARAADGRTLAAVTGSWWLDEGLRETYVGHLAGADRRRDQGAVPGGVRGLARGDSASRRRRDRSRGGRPGRAAIERREGGAGPRHPGRRHPRRHDPGRDRQAARPGRRTTGRPGRPVELLLVRPRRGATAAGACSSTTRARCPSPSSATTD